MKRKILITFLITMIFMAILINNSLAALTATAQFSASSNEAKAGEYVTCTFNMNVTDGTVNGFEGKLTYDKDFFSEVMVNSSYSINAGSGFNANSGLIAIESATPISSGNLFTVKLKISETTTKTSGTVGFLTSSDLCVFNSGEDCNLSVSDITINKAAAAPEQTNGENAGEQQAPNAETPNEDGLEALSKDEVISDKETTIATNNTKTGTAKTVIPKTGVEVIAIVVIAGVLVIGAISLIKYKNILK